MTTKQVPTDYGLSFTADIQDDGHVTYTLDMTGPGSTGEEQVELASYCPDTKELTLFDVSNEWQATDVVQTQLNHTLGKILGSDSAMMALLEALAKLDLTEVADG